MRDESGLKSALLRAIKAGLPGFVALRHEDVRTCGIPDLSLTGLGRTTWWECKHAAPDCGSTGIQELTMLRLAAAGSARYVVWEERRGVKRTLVVHPRHLGDLLPEAWTTGFDHRWLVEQMRKAHEGL
jgi:hypothetical protein